MNKNYVESNKSFDQKYICFFLLHQFNNKLRNYFLTSDEWKINIYCCFRDCDNGFLSCDGGCCLITIGGSSTTTAAPIVYIYWIDADGYNDECIYF